jgi:hypothetical protein
MANKALAALPAAGAISAADLFYTEQVAGSRKATGQQIADWAATGVVGSVVATRAALASSPAVNGAVHFLSEAGREGWFKFSTANLQTLCTTDTQQGIYVPPTGQNGSTGAWVRSWQGILFANWFGWVGDNVTDNATAAAATVAVMHALAPVQSPSYTYGNKACPNLLIPAGQFYLSTTTLEFLATVEVNGIGGGFLGCPATELRFAANTTGIRTIPADAASGATGGQVANRGYTAAGSVFRNLYLRGGYAGTESETYGVHLRSFAKCENVYVDNFAGDGFYAATTIGDSTTHGNASESSFYDCVATANRNGFFFDGADSNASNIVGCDSRGNRCWGFWDSSFLGNTYSACKTSGNGWDGAISSTPTASTIGGSRYYVKPGQATGASTNSPYASNVTITIASPGVITWNAHGLGAGTPVTFHSTGALPTGIADSEATGLAYYVVNPTTNTFQIATTIGGTPINTSGTQSGTHTCGAAVDNLYWGWNKPGGTYSGMVRWVNGTTFREGGGFKTDNANQTSVFTGCYYEGDQNPAQIQAPSYIVGGFLALAQAGTGLAMACDSSGSMQFGPKIGAAANAGTYFNFTNRFGGFYQLVGQSFLGGIARTEGVISFYSGNGILYDAAQSGYYHQFKVAGVGLLNIDVNGLRLFTTTATLGYGVGAGSSVVQPTNKATATPAINRPTGQVTMNGAALAAGAIVSFTLTNSLIGPDDEVRVWVKGGNATAGTYRAWSEGSATGSRTINVKNESGGSLSEALILGFILIKGAIT